MDLTSRMIVLLHLARPAPGPADRVPDRREGGRAGGVVQVDEGPRAFRRWNTYPATDQGLPEFKQQLSPGVFFKIVVVQDFGDGRLFGARRLVGDGRRLGDGAPEGVIAVLPDQPQRHGKRDDVDDRGRAGLEFVRRLGPDHPAGGDEPGRPATGPEGGAFGQRLAVDCQGPDTQCQADVRLDRL